MFKNGDGNLDMQPSPCSAEPASPVFATVVPDATRPSPFRGRAGKRSAREGFPRMPNRIPIPIYTAGFRPLTPKGWSPAGHLPSRIWYSNSSGQSFSAQRTGQVTE